MRRALAAFVVVASLVSASAASAPPAQAADGVTRSQAIALVKSVVTKGFQCAAPGWSVSRYSATASGSLWIVHVIATHPRAPSQIDVKFEVWPDGVIKPPNVLAEDILKCAEYEPNVPLVRAFVKKGVVEPGDTTFLEFGVQDQSEAARVHLNLYQGGTWVKRWTQAVKASDVGDRHQVEVTFGRNLVGPMFFCVWAENAAGGRSKNSPKSSCARISLVVGIERVSNGCGGAGWDSIVAIENYFGNKGTYTDAATGKTYTVNFTKACDLHDAGYGGQAVRDALHGDKVVDYQLWTRAQVDNKFRKDMGLLCTKIPKNATEARKACQENIRYWVVRTFGRLFFDADITKPGVQSTGPRA